MQIGVSDLIKLELSINNGQEPYDTLHRNDKLGAEGLPAVLDSQRENLRAEKLSVAELVRGI